MAIGSVYEGEYIENSIDQSSLTEILRESLKSDFTLPQIHLLLNFFNIIDIPDRKSHSTEMYVLIL
jgi:hypothetical protein